LTATEVQEITNIIELTGKALQSTRRIAHDLLPPVLDKSDWMLVLKSFVQSLIAVKQF
jgi:signal transduction histidine kinase